MLHDNPIRLELGNDFGDCEAYHGDVHVTGNRSNLSQPRIRIGLSVIAGMALLLLIGCAAEQPTEPGTAPAPASPADATAARLPPVGASPDYQLGGAYTPSEGVGIVARDRSDPPADDVYSICYVNGFQTQPGESEDWPATAMLHQDGQPVIDPEWPDEILLDTSTPEKRQRILNIVTPWIIGCADDGFDAVEFDNLDSYTRSDGALSLGGNLALAREFVAVAHDAGLAAGQKNSAEDTVELQSQAGFDFAVTEECAAFRECDAYTDVYGPHVVAIEYTRGEGPTFSELCAQSGSPVSMVHRDRDLTLPGDPGYVFEICAVR